METSRYHSSNQHNHVLEFWRGDKIVYEVIVYCTGGKSHGTRTRYETLDKTIQDPPRHGFLHVGSDGVPSHCKNKYSLDFLRQLKEMWIPVQWGFNTPSHVVKDRGMV